MDKRTKRGNSSDAWGSSSSGNGGWGSSADSSSAWGSSSSGGSSGGDAWGSGSSNSSSGGSTWGASSSNSSGSWGDSDNAGPSGNSWGASSNSGSSDGQWGESSNLPSSNSWGATPSDPWSGAGSSKRKPIKRRRPGAGIPMDGKPLLIILGVMIFIGLACFLFKNADDISAGLRHLGSALSQAAVVGGIITGIVAFAMSKLRMRLQPKTYLIIFGIVTVGYLLKNIVPGLNSLIGACVYAFIIIAAIIFLIKMIIKPN